MRRLEVLLGLGVAVVVVVAVVAIVVRPSATSQSLARMCHGYGIGAGAADGVRYDTNSVAEMRRDAITLRGSHWNNIATDLDRVASYGSTSQLYDRDTIAPWAAAVQQLVRDCRATG